MITAGLARERATRAIKKDTYYKIEEAIKEDSFQQLTILRIWDGVATSRLLIEL